MVGDWVMLSVREGAITYHKARVTAVSGSKVTVRHNDLKGSLEDVPVASSRLWHGTLEDKAWEVSLTGFKQPGRIVSSEAEPGYSAVGRLLNGCEMTQDDIQD